MKLTISINLINVFKSPGVFEFTPKFSEPFVCFCMVYIRYQLEFGLNSMRFDFSCVVFNKQNSFFKCGWHGKRFPVADANVDADADANMV